jgi:hypothetical protein
MTGSTSLPKRRRPRGIRCCVCDHLVGQRWAFFSDQRASVRGSRLYPLCRECGDDVLSALRRLQREHAA